ncbi:hypothetical protein Dd703_2450 [Musicola paradisiaca Ech703]|uniref:Uncharacterized protein n=1 Tax=Musicola paradisiaca (strain Ech703) TaxID=579405 RepID=C6C932_MUSP7|nr:hypothetical protein Dd703_2450 [Musicola paradisiaca Ech703]
MNNGDRHLVASLSRAMVVGLSCLRTAQGEHGGRSGQMADWQASTRGVDRGLTGKATLLRQNMAGVLTPQHSKQ